jgi:putative transposase
VGRKEGSTNHGEEETAQARADCAQDDSGRSVAEGKVTAAVWRELGVSEATYHRWRNRLGGLKVEDAKRLKNLERENASLKRLLADAELEKAALKETAKGNF